MMMVMMKAVLTVDKQISLKRKDSGPQFKFRSQGCNMIRNVHVFLVEEDSSATARDLIKKTAEVAGVSERTARRMNADLKASPDGVITSTPGLHAPHSAGASGRR